MLDERSFGHVKSQESTFVYRMYTGNDVWVGERVHITQKTMYANEPVFGYSAFHCVALWPHSTNLARVSSPINIALMSLPAL